MDAVPTVQLKVAPSRLCGPVPYRVGLGHARPRVDALVAIAVLLIQGGTVASTGVAGAPVRLFRPQVVTTAGGRLEAIARPFGWHELVLDPGAREVVAGNTRVVHPVGWRSRAADAEEGCVAA